MYYDLTGGDSLRCEEECENAIRDGCRDGSITVYDGTLSAFAPFAVKRVVLDRQRVFVVDTAGDAPPQAFFAKKSFRVCVRRWSGDKRRMEITTVAV